MTGSVSLDFNPFVASKTSPESRIEVEDDGDASATMTFLMKRPGSASNPLDESFEIEDDGTIFFQKNVTFNSSVNIEGNLQKGSGTFKIDDPLDPANKYLSHSFVESPDMLDMYNGTVTLDSKGEAEVNMPDWFDALNQSFQYQLTAVGAPGPGLYIKEKVHGNQFKIAGGAAGLEVSWQLTGVRHDAWANAHRTPVEEAKPEGEVGTYLHPELFGAGRISASRLGSGQRRKNRRIPCSQRRRPKPPSRRSSQAAKSNAPSPLVACEASRRRRHAKFLGPLRSVSAAGRIRAGGPGCFTEAREARRDPSGYDALLVIREFGL